jgi:hypothetical protein
MRSTPVLKAFLSSLTINVKISRSVQSFNHRTTHSFHDLLHHSFFRSGFLDHPWHTLRLVFIFFVAYGFNITFPQLRQVCCICFLFPYFICARRDYSAAPPSLSSKFKSWNQLYYSYFL